MTCLWKGATPELNQEHSRAIIRLSCKKNYMLLLARNSPHRPYQHQFLVSRMRFAGAPPLTPLNHCPNISRRVARVVFLFFSD